MRIWLKILPLIVLSLFFAGSASAQGSFFHDIAWRYTPAGAFPASGAQVTVCTSSGTGAPCTPHISLFADAALAVPVTNPLPVCTTSPQFGCIDGLGNFSFYASTLGPYTYTVTGAGLTAYGPIPMIGSLNLGANNAFTGNNTFANWNNRRVLDGTKYPYTSAGFASAVSDCNGDIACDVVDAMSWVGAQTLSTNAFSAITKPITVLMGGATLSVNAKLTLPSGLKWIGNATTIKQNFGGDYLLEAADLTNGSDDVEISGFTFDGNSAAAGFALLHIRGKRWKVHDNFFKDARALAANTLIGIRLDGVVAGVASDGSRIYSNTFTIPWIAVSIATNANANIVTGNYFKTCFAQIDINGDAADASGNIFSYNTIDGGQENSFLQSVTGTSVIGNTWRNPVGPANGAWLTVLLSSGAQKLTVISSNLFLGNSSGGYGLLIQNNVSYFIISGNLFDSNGLDGIFFNVSSGNTTRGTISGNYFRNNGTQNAAGGFSAIRANTAGGTTVQNILVTGNNTLDDQGTPSQTYGISFVGAGTYNSWTVMENDFSNNKTSAFNFGVIPTNSQFGPNREDGTGTSIIRPTVTVPDIIVGRATTDTLTNKTLTGASNGNNATLLNAQVNAAAITGTGAAATIYTYTLPASTVANLKGFRLNAGWNHSTGTASVSYNATLNGVSLLGGAFADATAGIHVSTFTVLNTGATAGTAQTSVANSTGTLVALNANVLAGLAWSSPQVLVLTFNVAATDQVTPLQWLVEMIQ